MEANKMMDNFLAYIREKYPEAEVKQLHRPTVFYQRVVLKLQEVDIDVILKLRPEQMVCDECAKLDEPSENIVPVLHVNEEEYGIACVHMLSGLRHWRALNEQELKEYNMANVFNDFKVQREIAKLDVLEDSAFPEDYK